MGKILINNKYNRKRNLFPYTEKILPSGFIKPIFNHLAITKYNELIQLILKTAQENDIKQNLLIKTWNKKTQIPLRKAKNILNGTEEIELWEYILLAEILEINILANNNKQKRYSHSIENSAFGRKLFITSNNFLKFTITINFDDILNINITFHKNSLIQHNQTNYKRESMKALQYYFKDKLPFTKREYDLIFRTKWGNNNFKFIEEK